VRVVFGDQSVEITKS